MSKYLTHEEARLLINHAKSNQNDEWLNGWDLGRAYGRFCEQQDIIKLLEEHDWSYLEVEASEIISVIKGEK